MRTTHKYCGPNAYEHEYAIFKVFILTTSLFYFMY